MGNRETGNRQPWTEDKQLWVEDMVMNNISQERMIKGFLQFYVLGCGGLDGMEEDMVLRTSHTAGSAGRARARMEAVLRKVVDGGIMLEA